MATCIDCNITTKNKKARRCNSCWVLYKSSTAHGRTIGIFCKICGEELSYKKSKTLLCRKCYCKNPIEAWNKGKKGICNAWNKGKSIFNNPEEYRIHKNKLRIIRYHKLSAKEKIADRIRTLIRNSIKYKTINRKKSTKTEILLGCSIDKFILYLELSFKENMSWGNYGNGKGKWNIDHIVPISKYNLEKITEQKKAFHFTNCQPMWSDLNFKKGNRVCFLRGY